MNITNFRDIGGYETADGRHVKHGFFYRSAPIVFQTDEDRAEFAKLNMKTILDLRSPEEVAQTPDDTVEGCTYIHSSAIPFENEDGGNFDMTELIRKGELQKLAHYVIEVYKSLPFQNPAYQILFDLLREDKAPLVFHCSAGKDRTGFAAYLILKTLGVPDKTIMQDYMLSNVYRKEENEKILALIPNMPGADELLYVQEKFLQSSMDAISQKYDSFETYVREEYGVTEEEIHQFRERYLE